jgi:hypothetical protein
MTLTVFCQYRDYVVASEARLLVQERQMELVREAVDFYKAKNKQTEDLAKAVIIFVKTEGLPEQQVRLGSIIKQSREGVALSTRPPAEIVSAEDRKAEIERQVAAMSETELLESVPKLVTLADRVREFEHFLTLKKEQIKKKREASDEMATVAVAGDTGSMVQGSMKIAEMTGGMKSEGGQISSRKYESGPLASGRTAQDFPFTSYVQVQNVQKILALLSAGASRKQPSQQAADALREEANRDNPKYDWLCGEIVSNRKKYRLDTEWRNDQGRSLLHVLCQHEGCGKAVKLLLGEARFDPTTTDELGLNAMHS